MAPWVIKKTEFLFSLSIFILFLFVVGKYADLNWLYRKSALLRHQVEVMLPAAKGDVGKEILKQHALDLILENNKWKLTGEGSDRFKLTVDRSGNLSIEPSLGQTSNAYGSHYRAYIDGVDTYYSIDEKIETDIPVDPWARKIRIYEQEDLMPVFGYHHILDDGQPIKYPGLQIHRTDFERQIAYMTNTLGCRWYTFGNLVENYILKGEKVPKRACALNFDDGRKNQYTNGYQVFKKYGAVATFYIIADRAYAYNPEYINISEMYEVYKNGNEIGSHTVSANGLIGDRYNEKGLRFQIERSKEMLEDLGVRVTTFAYPKGEQNKKIVDIVKQSYLAGRDTQKDSPWRDPRTVTASLDPSYLWYMNYYKPEVKSLEQIQKEVGYNSWWQFEEGFRHDAGAVESVKTASSYKPTENSYAVASLASRGDKISNKFLVSVHDTYTLELYGTVNPNNERSFSPLDTVIVSIDGKKQRVSRKWNNKDCVIHQTQYYCYYTVTASLTKGEHILSVEATTEYVKLDKFRMYRELPRKDIYQIIISEDRPE